MHSVVLRKWYCRVMVPTAVVADAYRGISRRPLCRSCSGRKDNGQGDGGDDGDCRLWFAVETSSEFCHRLSRLATYKHMQIVHIYVRTRMQTQTRGLPPTHAPYNSGEGDEGTAAGHTTHGRRQVRWLFGSVGVGVSVRANAQLGSQPSRGFEPPFRSQMNYCCHHGYVLFEWND